MHFSSLRTRTATFYVIVFAFAAGFAPVGHCSTETTGSSAKESYCSRILAASQHFLQGVKREVRLLRTNQSSVAQLEEIDSRFAMQKLITYSPTLRLIDNFSAAATLKTIIFSSTTPPPHFEGLKKASQISSWKNNDLDPAKLSPNARSALRLFDSRFRVAANVLALGHLAKFGFGDRTNDSATLLFKELVIAVLNELRSRGVVTDLDVQIVSESLQSLKPEAFFRADDLSQNKLLVYFTDSFLSHYKIGATFRDQFFNLSAAIDTSLEELYVGIGHQLLQMTSMIIFGDQVYMTSWGDAQSNSLDVYLRNAELNGGLVRTTLRLTSFQKRKVALILARLHSDMDPIFETSTVSQNMDRFQLCGTYVPYVLTRSGFFSYPLNMITPGGTSLSLTLQHLFGRTEVEKVELSCFANKSKTPFAIAAFAIHDLGIGAVEYKFYLAAITKAGQFIFSLF